MARAHIGQVVLVGIGTDQGETVYRPCIVAAVYSEDSINGQVITDGENDRRHFPALGAEHAKGGRKKGKDDEDDREAQGHGPMPACVWVTSVPYSATGGVETWHRPGDLPGETRRGDLQAQQSP
jgi:hypothetical protein